MSLETETVQPNIRPANVLLLILLFILIIFVGWQLWPSNQSRALKPFHPTATPATVEFDGTPISVSFPDLQATPSDYVNKRIRVTGSFTRIPLPDCIQFSGPVSRWGLISDELQMNGSGMESIMRLIPPGTTMTIEGIWRQYLGPVGCGKEPEDQTVWYLVIEQILQPNPLPTDGTPIPIAPPTNATPTATAVSANETNTPAPETPDPSSPDATMTPTPSPTNGPIVLTPTPSPTNQTLATSTPTPTSASATAVPTNTPPPNSTPTTTPTSSATPSTGNQSTATPGSQPPPASTNTPGPTFTPGPSPTPDNYPPPPPTSTPYP